jgi:hypothetical protein
VQTPSGGLAAAPTTPADAAALVSPDAAEECTHVADQEVGCFHGGEVAAALPDRGIGERVGQRLRPGGLDLEIAVHVGQEPVEALQPNLLGTGEAG